MAYTPKLGDKVKVKGQGNKVFRVLDLNTNAAMIEAAGKGDETYEVTWAPQDALSKYTPPKKGD
jgi:hypothetical protein